MRSLLAFALLATSPLLALATPLESRAQAAETNVVNLGYAKYRGTLDSATNVINFLGVRYAAAPTGDLRFKSPRYPGYTSGVQDANAQPSSCMAAASGTATSSPWLNGTSTTSPVRRDVLEARAAAGPPSEDCLFLNVHVPGNVDPRKKLPVVVWIHGGGYLFGNAALFDGSQLVVGSKQEVISVVIQYRLGIFGFLAGKKVKSGGSLNAGLLDQEFALKWVQQHICEFGGDASKVTIWGQSAGGGSVLQHLTARGGHTFPPLFRAGIGSSPFLPPQYAYNDAIPEALYSQVVSQSNCASAKDSLACLRAADVSVLQAANLAINAAGLYGTYTTVPVVDGTFIQQRVTKSLKEGKTNGAKVLTIANTNDGYIFVNPNATYAPAAYAKQVFPKLSDAQATSIGDAYAPFASAAGDFAASTKIMGDSIFLCPALYAASSFSKGKTAYTGEFAITPALHLQDLSYYFTGLSLNPAYPPVFNADNFKDTFSQSFLSFVVSGDPNNKLDASTSILPKWNKYAGTTEMHFGETADAAHADIKEVPVDAGLLERCKLWESLAATTAQ